MLTELKRTEKMLMHVISYTEISPNIILGILRINFGRKGCVSSSLKWEGSSKHILDRVNATTFVCC
jgi:hypothetical protein